MGKLTAQQVLALTVSSRTMSLLSLVGSAFITATFLRWSYFRKPINRLVFFASWGNVMANVATLISTAALPEPTETPSPLCQFQATLVQWFMMADSLWVFCMAVNVMLIFSESCDMAQLRRLEKWYLLLSYGLPFIPCLVYLILQNHEQKNIFGGALLWCWIGPQAEWLRIAFFYAPVWFVVSATFVIYIMVGQKVFKRRAELRSFGHARDENPPINPFVAEPTNNIVKQVDMQVTLEAIELERESTEASLARDSASSFSSTTKLSAPAPAPAQTPAAPANPAATHFNRLNWKEAGARPADMATRQDERSGNGYKVTVSANDRFGDTESSLPPRPPPPSQSHPQLRRTSAMEGNAAAWGYLKVAFLMFTALFIVWVPSTVNRLQQFIHKDSPVFGLNLASALVLPLQGFWNALVYVSTTWPECKRAWREIHLYITHPRSNSQSRKDSDQGLSSADPSLADDTREIPLSEMLGQRPPRPSANSPMSSAETVRPTKPLQPRPPRW